MSAADQYGLFGPEYSYADQVPLPGQIGVRRESSIGAIVDSVAGVNTYVDIIAFGGRTFFNKQTLEPMGIRYFMDTGMRCHNGATMSEYFDGVTRGDILGERVKKGLESAGLPTLRGLGPGMLENARDALDPRPIFSAVTATGYPICQQVECPVGDNHGSIRNPQDNKPYILDPVTFRDGRPFQRRWVQAYDNRGNPRTLSRDEFAAAPKCYNPDGSYMENPPNGCSRKEPPTREEQGSGRYNLCRVRAATTEGFTSGSVSDASESASTVAVLVATAVLGGLALWSIIRNK